MALSPSQEAVLDDFMTTLPDGVTWVIFGSVDSVLRGLDDDPNDVDVLTTNRGARAFRDAFPDAFVGTRELDLSRIDEYRLRGEEVEVVYRRPDTAPGEWLVDLESVAVERTDGRDVPLLPLDATLDAYRRLDRHDTADRLERAFGSS